MRTRSTPNKKKKQKQKHSSTWHRVRFVNVRLTNATDQHGGASNSIKSIRWIAKHNPHDACRKPRFARFSLDAFSLKWNSTQTRVLRARCQLLSEWECLPYSPFNSNLLFGVARRFYKHTQPIRHPLIRCALLCVPYGWDADCVKSACVSHTNG